MFSASRPSKSLSLFFLDTGLDFIHKRYSVHRDVKPGNVLVHTNGMIKIAGHLILCILFWG